MAAEAKQLHIVFMNMAATGHMNPALPLVARLVASGIKVTYFVEETMRSVVEAVGATWHPFRYPRSQFTGILRNLKDFETLSAEDLEEIGVPPGTPAMDYGFPISLIYNAQLILPSLIQDLKALRPAPAAIVYEPFLACALVAARVLQIPPICFLTMPGPGVLYRPDDIVEAWEGKPWVQKPRHWIKKHYGIDLLVHGALMEFYSPTLNLVSTIKALYHPPLPGHQQQRFGHFPFRCVGAVVDPGVKRIQNAGDGVTAPMLSTVRSSFAEMLASGARDHLQLEAEVLLYEKVRCALAAGQKIVLISLGTVVTGRMWDRKLSFSAANNDGVRGEGVRGIMDYTGKEICEHVYRISFEALSERDDTLVILTVGSHINEVLERLPDPPPNFLLQESVPQLELLQHVEAFVTHGGANSMHEALALGIPLVVIPIFGDQPWNADRVAKCGAGVSFRHPIGTLTADALKTAMDRILSRNGTNSYRDAAKVLAKYLETAGGVEAAADAVLKLTGASNAAALAAKKSPPPLAAAGAYAAGAKAAGA
eukprot:TRINITY_DN13884_c0_g4_i1.p1 TRINITY_DN13884_c0_g4~~TRINITY_DN13884_c0_g4_i1.p1  ORF type:complete len:556 (-),score=95.49 TRINITY_DN13884_c0_g4_i1:123-1736(-)